MSICAKLCNVDTNFQTSELVQVCVAWRNSLEALLGDLSPFIEFPPPILDGVPDVTGTESHFLFMGLNLKVFVPLIIDR